MEREVYADLYFLINACMDFLGLLLTAILLHRRIRRRRAVVSACLGGLYAVVSLLLLGGGMLGFAADCLTALGMTWIALPPQKEARVWKKATQVLKSTAVYALVSMLLGGVMTALYSLLNRLELPLDALQGEGPSAFLFALLTLVSGLITVKGGRFLGISHKTRSVTLKMTMFEKNVTLSALVDTGNLLRDPVSGRSVIVAELKSLAHVLPPRLAEAIKTGDYVKWLSSHQNSRITRLIPTKTANGESLLLSIIPQRLTVDTGKEVYDADYLIAPAPLGDSAKGFDALIGTD